MVLLNKKILVIVVLIMCVSFLSPNAFAFFGGKTDEAVKALDDQMAGKAQEYQSIISNLNVDLAETTKKLDEANTMIKDLNEKLSDTQAIVDDYRKKLSTIQEHANVAGDEIVEDGKSSLLSFVDKVKGTVTGDDKVCDACGEIKGSEQCCKDTKTE